MISFYRWNWVFGIPGQYCDLVKQLKVYLDGYQQSDCPEAEAIRKQCNTLWDKMLLSDQEEISKWGVRYLCR